MRSQADERTTRETKSVRERVIEEVEAGLLVDVTPTAIGSGITPSGLYARIGRKEVAPVRVGRRIKLRPEVAAQILGMTQPEAA